MSFVGQYILALLVVALMLFGLYGVVRALGRSRLVAAADQRIVTVVESTQLAQNATLHVIKVADRYYMVGSAGGHISTLAEVSAEQMDSWLDKQRTMFAAQRQSMSGFFKRLRRSRS